MTAYRKLLPIAILGLVLAGPAQSGPRQIYSCAVLEFTSSDRTHAGFAAANAGKVFQIEDHGDSLMSYSNGPGFSEGALVFNVVRRSKSVLAGAGQDHYVARSLTVFFGDHQIEAELSLSGGFGANTWKLACGLTS